MMLRLMAPGEMTVGGIAMDKDMLRAFYAYRHYDLAWNGSGGLGDKAAVVYAVLASADEEGLEPADYHVNEIARLANATTDVECLDRDMLLSDGLIHYAADIAGGRLSSKQTDERFADSQSLGLPQYIAAGAALDPDRLRTFLAELAPAMPEYAAVKAMLARARRLADSGGWLVLPDGGAIRPGMHDPAVAALRQRLIAEGWIAAGAKPPAKGSEDLYDPTLSHAVAAFQSEHAIKPDGVLGKDTRAALDVPADQRAQQAAVNLERLRWSDVPGAGRAVQVNLAAYSLSVFQDGAPVLTMPVVVGTPENPTPMIQTRITTVVLNPNWTLPPKVIKEMLPRIREDADYLESKGISRHEREDGKVRLVQPPGPGNPLGRYKFIMPNDQDIYLHDSPDSAKFRYALRAYSHGCIRLSNPAGLAALLLDDRMASMPDGLDALVHTGETRHIALSRPVPIALVYRTAWLDGSGHLVIGQDDYGRDARLWKALHKPRTTAPRKSPVRTAMAG
jgi:murein L,D-transpeptidase YcbB/YkuD